MFGSGRQGKVTLDEHGVTFQSPTVQGTHLLIFFYFFQIRNLY